MGAYSTTQANAYADKIKAVYECLGEIKKVADRLTPVEDLTSFQSQIEGLYGQLDLLVEASNVIINATPTGEAILTGSIDSIKTLLDIGYFPPEIVWQDELDAALTALQTLLEAQIQAVADQIDGIDLTVGQLDTYRTLQQSEIDGLQIQYQNLAGELETAQTNIQEALSRLTVDEEFATLQDQRLDSINESLASTITGLQATNDIVAGHTSSIQQNYNSISLHTAAIDQLTSELVDVNTGLTTNATALSDMQTTITSINNNLTVQSSQTDALKSVIGGSGNLLPNADFAANANGWSIVVAEEDWASTVLTVNLFSMPTEVNCLEVLGQPSPLGKIVVESPVVLVQGSEYYVVSGYPCVDNGVVELSYKIYDNLGNVVGQGACPGTFNNTTTLSFNSYTRTWVKFQTPPNATKVRLYLTVTGDGDFNTQGALFRPMVEKAWINQVGPSAWTPNVTGVPEALSSAIQTLNTEVTSINGSLSALSTAQTALDARVATAESALVNEMITSANKDAAMTASLNSLSTQLTDVEDQANATSSAVDDLTSRIDVAEDSISSNTSQLTTLQAQVDSMDSSTGGYGSAISALDTRVTATEDDIASMSSDITALQSSSTFGNKIYAQGTAPSTSGGHDGDLWFDTSNGNKPYTLLSGVWTPRQDLGKNTIFVQPDQPTAKAVNDLWIETDNSNKMWRWNGTTWVDATDARISANATAISELSTRTTAAENSLTSQASQITNLNTSLGAKTTTFVQGTAPSSSGRVIGDVWIDTSTGNTIKTWSGTAWVARPDNNRSKVYVQPDQPTGTLNVNDLWYDTDDNNKPYIWNGSSWTDITDQRTLANAAATAALTTRVTNVEGVTTSQASSITNLQASLSDVGSDNLLLNSSFEEGTIEWVGTGSGVTGVVVTFVTALLPVGVQAMRIVGTAGAVGNYLDVRPATTNYPKVVAGKKYTLSGYGRGTATGTVSQYIQWLNASGGVISTSTLGGRAINATTYTRYTLTDVAPVGAVKAIVYPCRLIAGATGAQFVEVDNVMFQEGDTVSGYKLSSIATANAVEALDVRVSANEDGITTLEAKWNVTLDVNGYITGLTSVNNGTTGSFIVNADKFSIVKPGGIGARTEYSGGNWRVYDSAGVLRVRMGVW